VDRAGKHQFVETLHGVFAETSIVVVSRNEGLTVDAVTDLRRRVRAAGAHFRVAKNRLAMIAAQGTPYEGLTPMLKGPTALAWAPDPVAVARVINDYTKANEKLVLVGGMLGETVLTPERVRALADLPSLDELRARLVGLISTPATRIAGVLQAPAGQLARVFAAYAKKDEAAAEAA
jgi:large subunit ribosomal protein L10